MADKFCVRDDGAVPRVLIAGDACHTHSPKAGQGMNVSMMDSYNMAWKLAFHLQGIASESGTLLDSYETERRAVAAELIACDNQSSSMFSDSIDDSGNGQSSLTSQDFEDVFRKINGFTTGCGIEYPTSDLVLNSHRPGLIEGDQYLNGVLKPGRRLFNVRVLRHADSAPWNLQDDFPSIGRFGLLVPASTDLLNPEGASAKALNQIDNLLTRYPPTLVQLTVLHSLPDPIRGIAWKALPAIIRKGAEMRFHSARPGELPEGQAGDGKLHTLGAEGAYGIFGVKSDQGGIAVIRPDGYVGMVAALEDVPLVSRYLDSIMARQA